MKARDRVTGPIRVMIAADDQRIIKRIVTCFSYKHDTQIVAIETDGLEAKEVALRLKPDVLVLDLVLPTLDGLAVMQVLRGAGLAAIRIIVLSAVRSDVMLRRALGLGAYYYLIGSFSPEVLHEHVVQSVLDDAPALPPADQDESGAMNIWDDERALGSTLTDVLGLSQRVKGTLYLKAAVTIARGLDDMGGRITKEIYPGVARTYGTNPAQVERAIRCAINSAWNRGQMRKSGLFPGPARPSNGEVIALLVRRDLSERNPHM